MEAELNRDFLMYAAIFGIFGFSWLGWAQEAPPKSWRIPLGFGAVVSLIIACIGGYLAFKNWNATTSLANNHAYETFGLIVGIEVGSILLGSLFLLWRKSSYLLSTWIAFIVGIHFIPLAILFNDGWLYLLAGGMCMASLLAVILSKRLSISIVSLTGASVGLILLCFALRGLVLFFF